MICTPPTPGEATLFLQKVIVLPNGCWLWNGARSKGQGNRQWYGSFNYRRKVIRAHVFAHDILAGKSFTKGCHRDHTCSFSLCVNPDHIECVHRTENQNRKVRRQAQSPMAFISDQLSRYGITNAEWGNVDAGKLHLVHVERNGL